MSSKDQFKRIYISSDFDFSGSIINGKFGKYEFDKIIGGGSQGLVLKFSNNKQSVIYKWNNDFIENRSTQCSDNLKGIGYYSYLNERDFLRYITVQNRINAFTQYMTEDNKLKFEDGNPIFNNEKLTINAFLYKALEFDYVKDIMNSDFNFSPIIVDWGNWLEKDGQRYQMISKPSSPVAEHAVNWSIGSSGAELYSFIEGELLENKINDPSLIPELIRTISLAHSIGILHRDIKPENLIVTKNNKIKLIDYGISRIFFPSDRCAYLANMLDFEIDSNIIFDKEAVVKNWYGSRLFNSKEALNGNWSNKDDIYATGIIASIMATGEHPYIGNYSNLQNKIKDHKRQLQKDINAENNILINKYNNFIKNHPNLGIIGKMFNPNYSNIPNRMKLVSNKFNIEYSIMPPIISEFELRGFSFGSEYEEPLVNALKKRGDVTAINTFDYEINLALYRNLDNIKSFLNRI